MEISKKGESINVGDLVKIKGQQGIGLVVNVSRKGLLIFPMECLENIMETQIEYDYCSITFDLIQRDIKLCAKTTAIIKFSNE